MHAPKLEGIKLAFIGAGSMAEALISGLINSGTAEPGQVWVTNRRQTPRLTELAARWQVRTSTDKEETLTGAGVVVLAVKPQDAVQALTEAAPHLKAGQLVISVLAGIPIAFIQGFLAPGVGVVRTMPNTSCLVGESATALSLGPGVTPRQAALAETIFASVGKVVTVAETAIDAVTGLSGSGPAYVYLMIEALTVAGVQVGLDPAVAGVLAGQTVFGAAKMVLETGEDPEVLRRRVMSPGGTTVEGLKALEEKEFVPAVVEAVARATRRAGELAEAHARSRLGELA